MTAYTLSCLAKVSTKKVRTTEYYWLQRGASRWKQTSFSQWVGTVRVNGQSKRHLKCVKRWAWFSSWWIKSCNTNLAYFEFELSPLAIDVHRTIGYSAVLFPTERERVSQDNASSIRSPKVWTLKIERFSCQKMSREMIFGELYSVHDWSASRTSPVSIWSSLWNLNFTFWTFESNFRIEILVRKSFETYRFWKEEWGTSAHFKLEQLRTFPF